MRQLDADTVAALAKAWVAVGPSPCEHFACAHAPRCARHGLACDAFRLYAERGRTVSPYAVVKDTRQRGMQVVDMALAIEPSRQVYGALFPARQPAGAKPKEGALDATGG